MSSSWKSAFSAISIDTELAPDHKAVIQSFLADPEVLGRLTSPFDAFAEPSAQTKAIFETRTSAINVTPSSNARYDVKEIKEDALWLSSTVKIDEVTALRVVVEECQSRASAQLLGSFSEEELASIREAAGNSRYTSSVPVALLSQGADPEVIKEEFEAKDNRKQRILFTYLSERTYFLKCVERLLHAVFVSGANSEDGKGRDTTPWLAECGKAIIAKLEKKNVDDLLLRGTRYIETNIKNIEIGSGWFGEEGGRESVEMGWITNQITEATHTMEILWHFLTYVVECPSSQLALAWFKLQQTFGFFGSFSMVRTVTSSDSQILS